MACGGTCGINAERERELARAKAVAAQVFAQCREHERDRHEARPVSYDELAELGAKLETLLPVRALVRPGERGGCDALLLLVGLHAPCLEEISLGVPLRAGAVLRQAETYVRLSMSPRGRFCVVQELVVTCEREADGLSLAFEPQAGVVDRRLQHIVKGLQGALRRARLTVLDLGAMLAVLDESLEVGAAPVTVWSQLFEVHSPLAARACWIPRELVPPVHELAG